MGVQVLEGIAEGFGIGGALVVLFEEYREVRRGGVFVCFKVGIVKCCGSRLYACNLCCSHLFHRTSFESRVDWCESTLHI